MQTMRFNIVALATLSIFALQACNNSSNNSALSSVLTPAVSAQDAVATATPIKHVVVIFNENRSFDHYYGTYPNATNPVGETPFTAATTTPTSNNYIAHAGLLSANGNLNSRNGTGATNPFRLDVTQANTADQNHAYTAEQQAYDNGLADLFPLYTGKASSGGAGAFGTTGQVMGYFDGNTVTGLWNYAQHFAMSDSAYDDDYGPSTPGALELVSGQTNGVILTHSTLRPFSLGAYSYYVNDGQGGYTLINDVDPANDTCSSPTNQIQMSGKNIGDLLNAAKVTWGGFMGGFNLSTTNTNGTTTCARSTAGTPTGMSAVTDYIPHHNWFQYYATTSNPTHARPSSTSAIGYSTIPGSSTAEPANHQYGMNDFFAAVSSGNFPSVSFLKAPAYQDAHPGYSDPIDEQAFIATVVNFLQQQPDWQNTAVIITYDDSDGWYDHAYLAPTHGSFDPQADQLNGPGTCGTSGTQSIGVLGTAINGRCGPGTRIPLTIISPWAKTNYISHVPVTLASVTRFIEDNWLAGQRLGGGSSDASTGSLMDLFNFSGANNLTPLWISPATGAVLPSAPAGSTMPKTL